MLRGGRFVYYSSVLEQMIAFAWQTISYKDSYIQGTDILDTMFKTETYGI